MNLSKKAIRWFRDAYNLLQKNHKTIKRMKTSKMIKTYKCLETKFNHNMLVTECWTEYNTIFLFDRNGWVKAGDEVKIEVNEKGFYERIWVNGELKTKTIKQ